MSPWREVVVPATADGGRSRRLSRALVPFVIAGALALLGLSTAAILVAAVGLLLGVATVASPALAGRVERLLAAVGRAVAVVLSTLLLGLVALIVFLPVALMAKVTGRDLLTPRGAGRSSWTHRAPSPADLHSRPYGAEPTGRRHGGRVLHVAYVGVRVVGWVAIALVLNYGLGWVWDEYFGSHDMPAAAAVPAGSVRALERAEAMRAEPWAEAYWDEFRALRYEYHPFILSRVGRTEGRHIRTEGAVRRSYEPADLADAPEVWFLGGAALWGQGQRDLHTVPSEVARMAEDAGTPIRAVNLGQPGYTSWQAALLLEQQLAVRPPPDLVVVYDGAADVAVQLEQASDVPTHHNVEGAGATLIGRDSAREQAEDWWQTYRETSVVNRLLDRVEGLFGARAAGADGLGLADRVADLHARSVDLASYAGHRHGVEVVFTWQAAEGVVGDGGAYRRLAGDNQGGVIDLSQVLDDEPGPVFMDGVLTNERGARVVAGALWQEVGRELG